MQNCVDNLARGQLHPSCFPAGKQKSAVNPTSVCPPHSASVASAQQVYPVPTPPCSRIGGFKHDDTIDWTHLDEVSHKETSSKCVQSMSHKRNVTLAVKSEQRTPKRVSPDRAYMRARCRYLWQSRCFLLHNHTARLYHIGNQDNSSLSQLSTCGIVLMCLDGNVQNHVLVLRALIPPAPQ